MFRVFQIAGLTAVAAVRSVPRLLRQRGRSERLRTVGDGLAGLFERLGPVFVKLGQLLSVRRDLLPEELIAPLRRLQDQVAAVPFGRIEASLKAIYGRPLDEIFERFDRIPLACGSIAQVYRARLREPAVEVAVKVLRPGTKKRIERDLRLLTFAGGRIARLKAFQRLPVVPALRQICEAIRRQADLQAEAAAGQRFQALFANRTRVRFPEVFPRYSNSEAVVMSYFASLAKIDDPSIKLRDYRCAVEDVLQVLYGMTFTHGFIHCDLHPGNVHVLPEGTPVILDCGLTVRLEEKERIAFRRFFMSIAHNDGGVSADILLQTSIWRVEPFGEAAFRREVTALVGRHSGAPAGEFQVVRLVGELFDVQRRHGLCGSPAFTMTILSLLTFEGVVKRRYPELDFQRAASPFFAAFVVGLLARNRGVVEV